MPYSIRKSVGGDSPSNDAYVERVEKAVERTGKSKSSAIAIAKASLDKHKTPHDHLHAAHAALKGRKR